MQRKQDRAEHQKKIEQTRICQVQDLTTDPERGTEKRRKGRDGETDGCQVSAGLSRQKWDCGITCGQQKQDESEEEGS